MKRQSINAGVIACVASCTLAISSCTPSQQARTNTSYKVMEIALGNRSLSTEYSATISGRQSVEIRPQISGVLTQVSIVEGATVKKGQTLFVIDQTPYKAALQTAIANVENAKANLATAKLTAESKQELFKQNVVSSFDLQTAQNSLMMANATLAQANAQELIARNDLAYTVIKSPVDGVASMTSYRVGALVNPSIATPLVTVSDDAEVYAYFSMSEQQVLALSRQNGLLTEAIKVMPEVQLKLSDGSMYDFNGKIDAISGIVNSSTGSVSVRATFPNTNHVLRSGGSANVIFPYEKLNCIVIPQEATFEIQDKVFAYKVVDGKAVSTQIAVFGVNNGNEYIVESGLAVGDKIIAEGAGLVREGTPVTEAAVQNNQEVK